MTRWSAVLWRGTHWSADEGQLLQYEGRRQRRESWQVKDVQLFKSDGVLSSFLAAIFRSELDLNTEWLRLTWSHHSEIDLLPVSFSHHGRCPSLSCSYSNSSLKAWNLALIFTQCKGEPAWVPAYHLSGPHNKSNAALRAVSVAFLGSFLQQLLQVKHRLIHPVASN